MAAVNTMTAIRWPGVWVDPETGLVLRHESEEGGGFVVTRFDLDYHDWDIQIRPDLFE